MPTKEQIESAISAQNNMLACNPENRYYIGKSINDSYITIELRKMEGEGSFSYEKVQIVGNEDPAALTIINAMGKLAKALNEYYKTIDSL